MIPMIISDLEANLAFIRVNYFENYWISTLQDLSIRVVQNQLILRFSVFDFEALGLCFSFVLLFLFNY